MALFFKRVPALGVAMLPPLNLNIWLCIGMAVRFSSSSLKTTAWYFC